jgi:hypothetical protein
VSDAAGAQRVPEPGRRSDRRGTARIWRSADPKRSMPRLRVACSAFGVLVALVVPGCKRSPGCSELGCFRRGVEIHVSPTIAKLTDAKLLISFDAGSKTCSLPLETEGLCAIGDHYPKQVKVQLWRGEALDREQSFDLTYETEYPNGKECPGKCDVASVRLPW